MFSSPIENSDLMELLSARPEKEIFHHENENEYAHAIAKVSGAVRKFLQQNKKPFSGIKPKELQKEFDAIDFGQTHQTYDSLLQEVEQLYTKHAVAFHHPEYIAHLNCPVVIPAVAAEVMIASINSSIDTWDQSAGGTLMEQKLVQWTCKQIGYDQLSDGIFTSGGTQSNLMGLLLARDYFALTRLGHNIKEQGLPEQARKFRIFVSEKAHFSIQKNASLLGLGEQAVIKIKTDRSFRMNTVLLEDAIKSELAQGNLPIAIVATAGTTDFGNVDRLTEIARLSAKYNTWFHVDAAYGCGLLLTEKHNGLLNGIAKANSITVDYHKSFFQPVSSSGFLVREKRFLSLITHYADYLNPKDHEEDGLPNQVNKSIQTTRRFDALKLWFTLRMLGKETLGGFFDTIIATAQNTANLLKSDSSFELVNETDISALVFRFVPNKAQAINLCELNQFIKKSMFNDGRALVAGTKINGQFYLKFTLLNPLTTVDHIQKIINIIKQYGKQYINSKNAVAASI